jgi:hypothetical protein
LALYQADQSISAASLLRLNPLPIRVQQGAPIFGQLIVSQDTFLPVSLPTSSRQLSDTTLVSRCVILKNLLSPHNIGVFMVQAVDHLPEHKLIVVARQ